nr:hypothetical protein [Tanacetum cinerariifolium]
MSSNPTQIPSPPDVTPKEEPVALDRPESPNPFLLADRVKFDFDQITFTTNNEVALLYPKHLKSEYFQIFSNYISKCRLRKAFTRAPNQYKEYLFEFWYTAKTLKDFKIWVSSPTGGIREEIGITTFRNALSAHYLPHLRMYVPSPSITIARPWFATTGYSREIKAKGTLKKSFLPSRWRLLMAQIIQCLGGKIGVHDQISNKDAIILYCLANRIEVDYAKVIWEDIIHKLNKKTSEKVVPYPRFISIILEYMLPEYDNEELTIHPTQVFSVLNWELKPNQHEGPLFTAYMLSICNTYVHVVPKAPKTSLHFEKKVHQGKNLELEVDSEENNLQNTHFSPRLRHPNPKLANQIRNSVQSCQGQMPKPSFRFHTCDSTAKAHPGKYAPNDSIPHQQDQTTSAEDGLKTAHTKLGTNEVSRSDELSKKIKLEDLSDLIKDTRSTFFTPDSSQDEPIIVSDESEESQMDKLKQQKVKAEAKTASLKAKPSYLDINHLTKLLVTSLKPKLSKILASHDFASSIPSELKELPSKITTLAGEIQELKRHVQTLKWELPVEFLDLPSQNSSVQAKLQTLDTLPSLLNKVANTLTRFSRIIENASHTATCKGIPSAGPTTASPAEGENNTNPATKDAETINLHNELVNLLGLNIVTQYYNKKLLYDKYCDKMLKRRKSSKTINCDVLTQKVPITLQVYREDVTIKFIPNVKVSDLHMAE